MKNTKKDSKKNHANDIKIYLKKKKIKDEKRLDKDIKILLKKKNKKDINITWNATWMYCCIPLGGTLFAKLLRNLFSCFFTLEHVFYGKKNCKLCPVSVFFLWKLLCLFLKVLEILMFNNFDSFITLAFS